MSTSLSVLIGDLRANMAGELAHSISNRSATVHEQINVANRCLFVSDQFAVCVCQLTDQQRRCLIIANRDAV